MVKSSENTKTFTSKEILNSGGIVIKMGGYIAIYFKINFFFNKYFFKNKMVLDYIFKN